MSQHKEVLPILVDDKEIRAEVMVVGGEEDVAMRALSFDGAVEAIEAIAEKLSTAFKKVCPQKATVEFEVQLSAEAGKLTALLVSGEGSATLRIGLEWGDQKGGNA